MDGLVAPTGPFADLTFHALAHLAVPGHTSLYDPRYVRWAEESLPREAVEAIATDAPLLAQLHASEPHVERLHALPLLHDTIEDMLAVATKSLHELDPSDVADPGVLASLRTVDEKLVEILRADLALAGPSYARAWTERVRPSLARTCPSVGRVLETACGLMPAMLTARVELAHPLGPRGRVAGDRIVVGAPATWNDVDPETTVVLALHERAVSLSRGPWARVEWDALREVARRMVEAPESLAEAHARWLAQLDLKPLVHAILAAGWMRTEHARRLLDEPRERPALLRRL